MGKIVAFTNVTLDGVMQAPGRADEDPRGGFTHGGWAAPYAAMMHAGATMAGAGALLFGRRTYQDFYTVWPARKESPFTPVLNRMQKYVASTTLKEPLPWEHSALLHGDTAAAVDRLKQEVSGDVVIMGSGELVQSLMRSGVIDEYVLLIHPLVLGSGRRLFVDDGAMATLQLVDSKATPTGVVIATYRPKPHGA